jgi:hypothetical protein
MYSSPSISCPSPSGRTLSLPCERSAPLGTLPAADRPALIIKSQNSAHVGGHQALRDAIAEDEDVVLFDHSLSRMDTLALVAGAACVLSLHRGEGLGLLIAEAMAYGVPVVATDYGGSTDLLTPEPDFLLISSSYRCPRTPIPSGRAGLGGCRCRPRRLVVARVFERPSETARRVENARQSLEAFHGPKAVAARQAARLRR